MKKSFASRFSIWLLAIAIACGIAFAFADATVTSEDATAATAALPAQPWADVSASVSLGTPSASASAPQAPSGPTTQAGPVVHGLSPLPNDDRVPQKWLPPGAFDPDRGPSDVIFPPQKLTIRFNHKFHMEQGLKCVSCHVGAPSSESVQDTLVPKGTKCDQCHLSNHADLLNVKPSGAPTGACSFCHIGYKDGDGNLVARNVMPRPNMVFSHKKHITRNIGCQQCHGEVQELEQATRDQMPRMRGCFGCHQLDDAASRGLAKGDCVTCHVSQGPTGTTVQQLPEHVANNSGGRMQTMFASGTLKPPRWLHNAAHSPDFMERHKMVAANDSQFCSNCHKEDFCVGCHDGKVRPKNVHPNDWISMHPIEARQATEKCTSCHREQSFCIQCHQRLGITMSGPSDIRASGRFHPPKNIWSDAPRKPGHHSQEAMRNINACVSCHVERDCVVCHGGRGIGGGFNPHNSGFTNGCATQLKRNPRPCLVCHEPGAGALTQCR